MYVFLGYSSGMKGYKMYDIATKEIFISRDVVFHEHIFLFHSIKTPESMVDFFPGLVLPKPATELGVSSILPVVPPQTEPSASQVLSDTVQVALIRASSRASHPPSYLRDYHCNLLSSNPIDTSCALYPLRDYLSYTSLSDKHKNIVLHVSSQYEPKFYHEAVRFPQWRAAMSEELSAMEDNQTWSVVPLPHGKHIVRYRRVYKTKYGSNGSVNRYKARLVAKGYTQHAGVDFFETFSPVAKLSKVKILFLFAAINKWNLVQLDINNVFLHGDIFEEVYMDLPLGYSSSNTLKPYSNPLVCKLNKSIYGLKQASRQWYSKFSQSLLQYGFAQSKSNYTLFTKGIGSSFIVLFVYVDDIIIARPSTSAIESLKMFLKDLFKLEDLGTLKYFLGLEIARSQQGIYLCQRHYTLQLLEDTCLLAESPVTGPMDSKTHLSACL